MMNSKLRLWRVDSQSSSGNHAPSFFIETATPVQWTREESEHDAIRIARMESGLGRFESWTFTVTHLEDHFLLKSNGWERWVKQGTYRLENGRWTRKPRQKE
jgi:hypothetical protein